MNGGLGPPPNGKDILAGLALVIVMSGSIPIVIAAFDRFPLWAMLTYCVLVAYLIYYWLTNPSKK